MTSDLSLSSRRRACITLGVMMGLFLGALEATVVGTAMPTVISSLGGLELYSWVFSVYFLAATVSVPLWGRFSDLYGRRLFYLAGITLFLVGSVLAGVSRSMIQLIYSRGIQGLGAGALIPIGMTIVADIHPLERRARIQGLFSGVWGFSSIVGPLLGGLITDLFSWRWVFFLNVPFGLLAGLIILVALREPRSETKPQIDYPGALLLTASLLLFFWGLDRWRAGFAQIAPLYWTVSILLVGVFWRVERRAADPIVPLHLFRDRIFFAAALNGFFCGMALFGAISFIPLFVQGVQGTGATEAGYALTPLMLGWVIFSVVSSRLILAVGYRKTVIAGMVFLMVGFFLLSRVNSEVSHWELVVLMSLIGMGMGLSMVSMLIAVQNRFPRQFRGIATSATQFFRTIGAALGIAVMGTIMARAMLTQLDGLQADQHSAELVYFARHPDSIVNPLARASIPAPVLEVLQGILGVALGDVFFMGFIVSVLAFGSAFLVPPGLARDHAIPD